MKFRHEINLTDVEADPVDSVEAEYGGSGIAYLVPSNYTVTVIAYFEVVAKNSSGSNLNVILNYKNSNGRGTGSTESFVTIPANTATWTRVRGVGFSPNAAFVYKNYFVAAASDSDISIKSAKIILLQSAESITDTQTQIEIGQHNTQIPAAATTWYAIAKPKYWKYEASKWDPAISDIKLGITVGCEDDKESYNFGLYDVTDADYKEDLITGVSTEAATYYESADFSAQLEDGHIYCLAYEGDDNKDEIYFFNAKIIVTQSDVGGVDKLQNEYLLINDSQTADTGNQEFLSWWDPDEWDGVSNIYYHEQSASHAASASKVEYDDGGSWTAIASSTTVGASLQRSAAVTMPSTEDEIDTDIIASS